MGIAPRSAGGSIRHLDYLDGWRGVAILLVLGDHFFHVAGGRLGVEVFFVLSGLLMSRILFETDISIATFYRRRIARIVPVFVLYLGFVAALAALTLPVFPWRLFGWNAAMLQAYMLPLDPDLPLGHLWSLNVEEHSYVLLSLIALGTRRRGLACAALAAAALCCAAMVLVHADLGVLGTRRSETAAFGLLAAAALHLALRDARRPGLLLAAGSLLIVGSIASSRALGGSLMLDYVAKPFGLALVVNTLHAAPRVVRSLLAMRWLRWFGVTSFSLYLWQQPFYRWALTGHMPQLAGLAGAIAAGAASYYLFETPMREAIRNGRLFRAPVLAAR